MWEYKVSSTRQHVKNDLKAKNWLWENLFLYHHLQHETITLKFSVHGSVRVQGCNTVQ